MSELLYIKWRNKTVTRQESAWSSFSTSPTLLLPAPLGMPFCVGHSQLGAAYQCLNSAALKHQQQQQPATRTTITPKRGRRRNMQQREATKSKLKYFKTPFYDNFAWYPSESFGTSPPSFCASHLPLGPSWLRSFLHIAGRRVALLATCCQRL